MAVPVVAALCPINRPSLSACGSKRDSDCQRTARERDDVSIQGRFVGWNCLWLTAACTGSRNSVLINIPRAPKQHVCRFGTRSFPAGAASKCPSAFTLTATDVTCLSFKSSFLVRSLSAIPATFGLSHTHLLLLRSPPAFIPPGQPLSDAPLDRPNRLLFPEVC